MSVDKAEYIKLGLLYAGRISITDLFLKSLPSHSVPSHVTVNLAWSSIAMFRELFFHNIMLLMLWSVLQPWRPSMSGRVRSWWGPSSPPPGKCSPPSYSLVSTTTSLLDENPCVYILIDSQSSWAEMFARQFALCSTISLFRQIWNLNDNLII